MPEPFLTMEFEGAEELAVLLDQLPQAASTRAQLKILRDAAEPMRVEMASSAPRGEGLHGFHLSDSMVISTIRDRQKTGDATVAVGPAKEAFWGLFQEMGTIHQPPRAFAGATFDNQTKSAFQILQEGYWALLVKWLKAKKPRGRPRKRKRR